VSSGAQLVFQKIYQEKLWGGGRARFYSGSGSHDPEIVGPYIESVGSYFKSFEHFTGRKPNVVDVGCGDFSIGSRIRSFAGKYVGPSSFCVETMLIMVPRRFVWKPC